MENSTTFLCPLNTGCRNHYFGYMKYSNPARRCDKQKEHFGSHRPFSYLCGASLEVSKEIRRWPASWSWPSSYILWNSRYFPVATKTKKKKQNRAIRNHVSLIGKQLLKALQVPGNTFTGQWLTGHWTEAQFIAVSLPYQETWADRWEALQIQDCQSNQGLRSRRFCNILIKTCWVRKRTFKVTMPFIWRELSHYLWLFLNHLQQGHLNG